ncbi:hypothetical protein [Nocardioides sp. YIM 152315]|uniref:hypothetical protein n=1 Tax=Nocardioides sp. YIM 152315 TaxID=3031760 RepID=UPI0023D99E69|nr:hypothetical protein [Nocardioides sp. YIM 152315]MDF1605907.1 hypothetical protein [Nocardioides sp. YIM 152315]
MSLKSVRPRETLHARRTRDGQALDRDGEVFVLINELCNRDGTASLEVMFEDGVWMLVDRADLDMLDAH